MATGTDKFLNYNGLVKLIGLIKKRINDAIGSIDLSWKTNKFVKSIAGYGTGDAPLSSLGVNETKNKLEGTYTTGNLDGTGTDIDNKFTYIDTTYGKASGEVTGTGLQEAITGMDGLMSKEDKVKLDKLFSVANTGSNGWVSDTKFVTGVKGSAESTYRTGQVNITAANIGVAAGAQVNVIEKIKLDGASTDLSVTDKRVTLPNVTTSASGLMSSSDKSRLDGIAPGAQANVLEGVQLNGTDLSIDTNKKVNIPLATSTTAGAIDATHYKRTEALFFNDSSVRLSNGYFNIIADSDDIPFDFSSSTGAAIACGGATGVSQVWGNDNSATLTEVIDALYAAKINGQTLFTDGAGSFGMEIKSGDINLTSNISVDGSTKTTVQAALEALAANEDVVIGYLSDNKFYEQPVGSQSTNPEKVTPSNNKLYVDWKTSKIYLYNNAAAVNERWICINTSSAIALSTNITVDGTTTSNVQAALTALNTLAAANKSAISTLQSGGLKREIISNAADWPTGTAIKDNVIYMILASIDPLNSGDPSTSATTTPYDPNNNSYNEYMYINNAWERIGSTEVNLDIDPITDDEIDTAWTITVAAA